jgi:UDP-N-acetylglucosamine transferase subunit ALG13
LIFVTVGTQLPFSRLVDAVLQWHCRASKVPLLIQHLQGASFGPPPHSCVRFVHALSASETREAVRDADVVVSHFGMGTLLTCLEFGRPLIALPRRSDLGETRNDHQLEGAARFAGRRGVQIANCEIEVAGYLDRFKEAQPSEKISTSASPQLLAAVRDFIWEGRTPPHSKS